jgi:hypothetical protein
MAHLRQIYHLKKERATNWEEKKEGNRSKRGERREADLETVKED